MDEVKFDVQKLGQLIKSMGANGKEIEYSELKRNAWGPLKRKYQRGKAYAGNSASSNISGVAKKKSTQTGIKVQNHKVMVVNGKTGAARMEEM